MPIDFVHHDVGHSISCIMHSIREYICSWRISILTNGEELLYVKSLEFKKLSFELYPSSFTQRVYQGDVANNDYNHIGSILRFLKNVAGITIKKESSF